MAEEAPWREGAVMGTPHRSTETHAWGTPAPREPVFAWTPPDPTAGRALLGRVRPERERGTPLDRLRFGTYLASNPTAVGLYELVTEAVGRRLGVASELVVESSYESCEKDQNEVCFVCSLPYVTFERRGLDLAVPVAAPVLEGARYGGRPIYFSDVIVHRDSPFRSFLDLRGRSWAYNEPLSHSGYGITRYHLVRLGETKGFFGEVVEAGFHHQAIRMVARGEVDGSAIDSQVLGMEFRDHPDLAKRVRVVEALGPSTIQPVAVSRRVPDDVREVIREALVTMAEDPAVRERLGSALVERFLPVDERSYDDIRMMVEACEAAGFRELR
jgi:phosphonate transport system substrate-binding protein